MNAASKALHQSNFFHGHIREMRFSFTQYLQFILFISVLLSAIAVVYCTNQYRMNLSHLEHAKNEASNLELQWGQLLLEEASMNAPSSIEARSMNELKMIMPSAKQTVIVRSK
jgi:cell division protein FtsL